MPNQMTVEDSGEFGLIAALRERLPQGPGVLIGPGDDGAVVAAGDGRVVVSTDVLVAGVHFRADWSSATDIGVRAAAANLADIAAMGASPTAMVVALALPADTDRAWVLALADGLASECERVGASVVGGDVSASPHLVISVAALGDLGGRAPVTRAGAVEGDQVAVAGRLGWAAAGLQVLSRGFRSPKVLVDAHRQPTVDYAAAAAAASVAHALCDVSDGLVADLGHIAHASEVVIDLDPDAVDGLVAQPLTDLAAALGGADPRLWVLGGGDDHAFAGTFAPDAELPPGWTVIGRVQAAEGAAGVLVGGHAPPATGHRHFDRR